MEKVPNFIEKGEEKTDEELIAEIKEIEPTSNVIVPGKIITGGNPEDVKKKFTKDQEGKLKD